MELFDDNIQPSQVMDIKNLEELLTMRQLLQNISNNTFNYSVINKQHPIAMMQTSEEAKSIMESYDRIIVNITDLINNYRTAN